MEDHGDSAPFIEIQPGGSYTYRFEVPPDHWTGTLVYHAHKHGSTGFQVGNGLFGALIVRDPPGRGPPSWLPDAYSEAEEEIVVVATVTPAAMMWMGTLMNETVFVGTEEDHPICDSLGAVWTGPESANVSTSGLPAGTTTAGSCNNGLGAAGFASPGITPNGNLIEWNLVNGQIRPIVALREDTFKLFRLVYLSIKRYVNLIITDDVNSLRATDKCEMQLIAKDGIYLNYAPRQIQSVILASGNRADVMIRCSEPGFYHLISTPLEGTVIAVNNQGGVGGYNPAHTAAMGVNPVTQGFLAEIHVAAAGGGGAAAGAALPHFMPERPPMLRNTTDAAIAPLLEDPDFVFNDMDILMSDQETSILMPSQLCFINGGTVTPALRPTPAAARPGRAPDRARSHARRPLRQLLGGLHDDARLAERVSDHGHHPAPVPPAHQLLPDLPRGQARARHLRCVGMRPIRACTAAARSSSADSGRSLTHSLARSLARSLFQAGTSRTATGTTPSSSRRGRARSRRRRSSSTTSRTTSASRTR